jgi:multicomponent Na+:H+ antiporter subunit D
MVGVPAFAGFSSKFLILLAGWERESNAVFTVIIVALAVSTALNALYFLRTVIRIYSHPEREKGESAAHHKPEYLIPAWVLVTVNIFLGLFPAIAISLLDSGFSMLF